MHLTMQTQLVKFVKLAVMSTKFCYAMDVIRGIRSFYINIFIAVSFFSFHTYCLDPPIETIPRGRWYCPDCEPVRRPQVASRQQQQTQRRLVTRTALAERVRRNLFTRYDILKK